MLRCQLVLKNKGGACALKPKLEIDSETYEVRADGELLTCQLAKSLPMAQRYFLF